MRHQACSTSQRLHLGTRLGEMLPDEAFWVSVLHYFVNNPMLDTACFGPIVDYGNHQKIVPATMVEAVKMIALPAVAVA